MAVKKWLLGAAIAISTAVAVAVTAAVIAGLMRVSVHISVPPVGFSIIPVDTGTVYAFHWRTRTLALEPGGWQFYE